MTACPGAHRRFVDLPGRRGRLSDPQALHRVGSSAGRAAVIEAMVPHTPTSLADRSKAYREARCWARVVFPSVMAVNHGLRRVVGVGSARGVGDAQRQRSCSQSQRELDPTGRSSSPPSFSYEVQVGATGYEYLMKRSAVRRKRVLTIADHLGSIGGTEAGQLAIFRGLVERDWEVHLLYVTRGDFWPAWKELAATTTQIGASLPSSASPLTSSISTFDGALKGIRTSPSVIYVHNAGDVPIALAMGARTGARVAVHLHLPPPIRQPSWLNSLMRRSTAAIAPSAGYSQPLDLTGGIGPGPSVGHSHRCRCRSFRPSSTRRTHGRASQRRRGRRGVDGDICRTTGTDQGSAFLSRRSRPPRCKRASGSVPVPADRLHICESWNAWRKDTGSLSSGLGRTFPPLWRRPISRFSRAYSWRRKAWLLASRWPARPQSWPRTSVDLARACGAFPSSWYPRATLCAWRRAIKKYVTWRRTDPDLGPRSRAWVLEHMRFSQTIGAVDEVITQAAWSVDREVSRR